MRIPLRLSLKLTAFVAAASSATAAAVTSLNLSPLDYRSLHADSSFTFNPFQLFSGAPPEPTRLSGAPGELFAWGNGVRSPHNIDGLPGNIVHAALGERWSAAIDARGCLWVWSESWMAKRLEFLEGEARKVAMAGHHIVVLDGKGRLWSGGLDGDGEVERWEKVEGELLGKNVKKFECSRNHCVAVTNDGRVAMWGSNEFGQAGADLSIGLVEAPMLIGKELRVKFVDAAAGYYHTVLLDKDGGVWACGDDMWGQLARTREPWKDNKNTGRSKTLGRAEITAKLPICEVRAGEGHTVLRVRDGGVVTCGLNQWGALAHHNFSSMAAPARIGSVESAIGIAAGRVHTGIVDQNGGLKCCGGNEKGQLGNGTLQPTATLRKVKGILGKNTGKEISAVFFGNDASAVIVIPKTKAQDTATQ